MDTKIKASFWSDATVEALDHRGKLAVLWLFTAHVSNCGWATATKNRFEFETGLKWSVLESATTALSDAVVKGKDGWWLRNYIRHQVADGSSLAKNNMRFPIKAALVFVPAEIITEILAEYPALLDPSPTPPPPLPPPEGDGKSRAEQSRAEVLDGKEVQEENLPPPRTAPCTFDQAKAAAANIGISADEAKHWYDSRASDKWMKGGDGNRRHVGDQWQHDMSAFTMAVRKNGGSKNANNQTHQHRASGSLNKPGRYA